jgi:cobalamin biosynthesis Mg chelatase CobN
MGGKAASQSSTSNVTSTAVATVTDSYNQTVNRVGNLSDVGNVKISGAGSESGGLPVFAMIFGIVAVVVLFILKKGG